IIIVRNGRVIDGQRDIGSRSVDGDAVVDVTRDHTVLHHAANGSPATAVGDDAEEIVLNPGAVDGDVGQDARGGLYKDSGGESAASVIGDMAVGDEELGTTV